MGPVEPSKPEPWTGQQTVLC